MKILVTGFEPFGGEGENASGTAVHRLAEMPVIDGTQVVTVVLPVTWSGAGPALLQAVGVHRPDAIVAVGEAGGREVVTPERWARNLMKVSKGKCKVLSLGKNNPCTSTCWGPTVWKAAFQRRTWGCWWKN